MQPVKRLKDSSKTNKMARLEILLHTLKGEPALLHPFAPPASRKAANAGHVWHPLLSGNAGQSLEKLQSVR